MTRSTPWAASAAPGLGGGNDEREQTLNSMLAEMDGFDTTEGVIIIAATNRPDVLDSALLRPGRFDRQVFIDLPDLVGREQILRVHSRKLAIGEDVDLSVMARGTPGLSGAELANLLNESALLAARRNKKRVDMHDIEDAREKVQFGRERRRIMDDEDKKIVAYHEAGHALVGAVVDDGDLPVHKVTIIPRGRSLGSTMYIPRKDIYNYAKRRMLARLATLYGGRIAEEVVLGDITSGASQRHPSGHQTGPQHGVRLGHELARPDRLRGESRHGFPRAARSRAARISARTPRA